MSQRFPLASSEFEGKWYDTDRFRKLSDEMASYGLTSSQSKVYLYLFIKGQSTARQISNALGMHRVEVYRKLRELEEMKLLEIFLDSPNGYAVVDPGSAVSSLLRQEEEKLVSFRRRSDGLVTRLTNMRDSLIGLPDLSSPPLQKRPYKLFLGRKRYYKEMKQYIRNAEHEILGMSSARGIIRMFLSGLYDECREAQKRGISVRMISEINRENSLHARTLANVVNLRHLDNVRLRFTVVDRSVSILSARYDEEKMSLDVEEDTCLVFEDPKFSEVFCFFFEHLWNAAVHKKGLNQKK